MACASQQASKAWVSWACDARPCGIARGCRASCAWLGREAVEDHSLKGSTHELFPPPFFLLALPLLSAVIRVPCKGGI